MHLSLPRRRAGQRIFWFKKKKKKSQQEAVLSASGSQEGMESHGRTNTGPHSSPSLASRQQWAVRERHQRPYSRTLCQTVEPGKCAPHTQTPLWSDTGRVPAFHLAAPPRVRRWSRRSRLYSVWVPGKSATQLVSLAPVGHLTRLRDSVRPAFSQVPPHSSKGLCGEITVLLAMDVMEPVPPADMKTGFYSPYFIVPKKGGGWRPILDLRVLNWASFRSRDSRRSASSGASVPEIGLQRLT